MIELGFEEWHMSKLYEKEPTATYVEYVFMYVCMYHTTLTNRALLVTEIPIIPAYIQSYLRKRKRTHDENRDNMVDRFEILFCLLKKKKKNNGLNVPSCCCPRRSGSRLIPPIHPATPPWIIFGDWTRLHTYT